jgi:hypothetical protein
LYCKASPRRRLIISATQHGVRPDSIARPKAVSYFGPLSTASDQSRMLREAVLNMRLPIYGQ